MAGYTRDIGSQSPADLHQDPTEAASEVIAFLPTYADAWCWDDGARRRIIGRLGPAR